MFPRKPTSRFILFALTLLVLLNFTVSVIATSEDEVQESSGVDADIESDELEELMAIDEQEEQVGGGGGGGEDVKPGGGDQKKEAEVLSKAQRIVPELNSDNAMKVIDGNEFVLVLGYAPWCSRSAELMPQFAEAANKLKELGSPLLLAKVDAERYPKVASMLGIKGFPTLLLFVNGSSQAYSGGFTGEDIVIWARKKTAMAVTRISSVAEAEEFLKEHHTFVLGLFEKFEGHDHEEFVKAAISDNEIQFVEVSNIQLAKVLFPDIKASKCFIGLVKNEPERYTVYDGTLEKDKLLQFLGYNKFPLVTRLTELNSERVYSSPIKLQVMIFANAGYFKNLIQPLQEVARKFKSKIMFIYVNIADENLAKPFLTLFGLEDSGDNVVTAFDNCVNAKYLLELDFTTSNIEEFSSGLLHGSLSPYFKSQPIPNNKEANVQIIVGRTFDDLVLRSPKNVLLEVHTPWCINCETTSKQVENLAKHFRSLDNLIFARIDASANEHPKLEVQDYPTLLFYPVGDKENPVKLSTKSKGRDLAATINSLLRAKEQATKDEL